MALVNDLGVRIVGCGTRVAVRDLILHGSDQGIFHAAMSHDVIDGNACLTSVKQLSPYDSLGRDLDVGRLVDDARALSAQFQRNRGKVLACRAHDGTAYACAAGEEDVVVSLDEQLVMIDI